MWHRHQENKAIASKITPEVFHTCALALDPENEYTKLFEPYKKHILEDLHGMSDAAVQFSPLRG